MNPKSKKYIRKSLKVLGWFVGILIFLLLALTLSLRIPWVQNIVKNKAVTYFRNQTGTEIQLDRLYVNFPSSLELQGLYVVDLKGDTLVYCGEMEADANLWGLLKNKLSISEIRIDSLIGNIHNTEGDSTFNYQFIIDAFVPPDSTTTPASDSSASAFDFGIYGAAVTNSRVRYEDSFNGIHLHAEIGDLLAEASEFDLNQSVIDISYIHLKKSHGSFVISKPSEPSGDTTPTAFQIRGEYANIEEVDFTFEDQPGGIRVVTDIGRAEIDVDTLDIIKQKYLANNLNLSDSYISVDLFQTENNFSAGSDSTNQSQDPLTLKAGALQIALSQVDVRFSDHSAAPVKGFNPLNFWIRNLDLVTDEVVFEDGYANGRINRFTFSEDHGFSLVDFHGSFAYQPQGSYLRDFYAETAASHLEGNINISYPSVDQLVDQFSLSADITPSSVGLSDVRYFVPQLEAQLPAALPETMAIHWQGKFKGNLEDLSLQGVEVSLLSGTHLMVNGRLRNVTDVKHLQADFSKLTLETYQQDIRRLVPDTLLPSNLTIPDTIKLDAKLQGSLTGGTGDIDLITSLGNLRTNFNIEKTKAGQYSYKTAITTKDLHPDKLLQQPDLGGFDLEATIEGKGITLDSMDTRLTATIRNLVYRDYAYKDVKLSGRVERGDVQANASIEDENLTFQLDGHSVVQDSARNYQLQMELKGIDLYELHLSQVEYKLAGEVDADITASSIDDLNGEVLISNLIVSRNNVLYSNDSLAFHATSTKDSTSYHLYSSFVDFDMYGKFTPSQLTPSLLNHVNQYYHLRDLDTLRTENLSDQSFVFELNIKDPEMLHNLVLPGIEQLTAGNMSGNYNSAEDELHAEINLFSLIYAGIGMDSVNFDINSNPDSLTYNFKISRIYTGGIEMANLELIGNVQDDKLDTDLHIRDQEGEDKYLVGGEFQSLEDHHFFRFIAEKFMLNYQRWKIKESNAIRFYDDKIWYEDLFLTLDKQQLKFHSKVTDDGDSVLLVELIKLNLNDLGQIVNDSSALVAGIVNGFVEFNTVNGGLAFRSDTRIDNFAIKGDTLGVVAIEGLSENGKEYDIDVEVRGKGNKLHLAGNYSSDSVQMLDIDLDIHRLNLITIDAITASQVKNMDGFLTGHVDIDGTTKKPVVDGKIRFNKAEFTPTLVNSQFFVDKEEFVVNSNGMSFDNFVIQDKNDNETVINGTVKTGDLTVFNLDLDIEMNDFLILDRPIPDEFSSENEDLFYGELKVNGDVGIHGTTLLPRIKLDASFDDGSTFAYVIPESTVTAQEQKDVVEWFDQDLEDNPFFNDVKLQTDTLSRTFQGIDLSATLSLNENNELTVVIDPVTGDRLNINGDADLNYTISPSGDMTLTGRYEVSSGSYQMNFYNLVKREFDIQKGSYILWTGDPYSAQMNITAEYKVRAAPVGLEDFSSKLDFIVYLDIAGKLLKPEISFRLGLAADARAPLAVQSWVQQKNSQPEDVNKQVFGLLIFKTFFADDPLSGSGNSNLASSTARSSVSKMLSTELSKLSNKIKGVELSVDLDSYEESNSEGQTVGRTQLELGLSKEFFNDRVVVKVAGNFDLENQEQQNRGMSEFAGDIRIEYKLTEDGRYRLVGFSENDYDNLQGDIVRTGAGFIFVREYDALRELFQKPEKEERVRKKKKNNKSEGE